MASRAMSNHQHFRNKHHNHRNRNNRQNHHDRAISTTILFVAAAATTAFRAAATTRTLLSSHKHNHSFCSCQSHNCFSSHGPNQPQPLLFELQPRPFSLFLPQPQPFVEPSPTTRALRLGHGLNHSVLLTTATACRIIATTSNDLTLEPQSQPLCSCHGEPWPQPDLGF